MTLNAPEVITLALAFLAMLFGFGKLLLKQIDARFAAAETLRQERRAQMDKDFGDLAKATRKNELDLLKLRAELPNEYVRREDWIRFSGTIDAKLDTLNAKFDALREDKK